MTFSSLLSIRSHPVRVRGLKLTMLPTKWKSTGSHPVRVRGLKPKKSAKKDDDPVAPRAGAWIETDLQLR